MDKRKIVIKRDAAVKQIERQNKRLAALNAVSMTVSSSLDLKEVLDKTIDKMLEIFEPDSIRVYLLDSEKDVLNLAAHKGYSSRFVNKAHMICRKVGDGLLGQAVITGEISIVDNFLRSGDPYVESFIEEGLQSTGYIPLVSKGKPVGVMAVSSHEENKYSAEELDFLSAIGNQIGMAVDNANLYEKKKRAYKELKNAREQVIRSEKLASLGKLAATVAHEINNPLAAVLTYIKLIMKIISRDSFVPGRTGDISGYLKTMESETARCGEIVRNLLAFSRQSSIVVKPQNVEEIIDKTLMLIAHDLEMNEIDVVKDIEPDVPMVQCDFKRIQQALLNLMSNAAEAMTKGGFLTVAVSRSEGNVEIVVSDTGCGISVKDQKNIFEPFFTTKEEGKGVGLGLSVVFGIISRHNGTIEVKSQKGKGSAFKVCLPVAL
ncbi:MAG: GAF domain-containing protein [Desulfobacterales bacterium]|nr:GAF domain-containing protein [Desulfobacterales bacterium]